MVKENQTIIYLVRHAEAMGNVEEFFQGRVNTDISEKGAKQLECLAERFRDIEFDVLYSSPLKRTLATAEAVNKYHGLPVNIVDEIIELNGGKWEGEKWADLPKLFPEEHYLWNNAINKFCAPEGESTEQVYDRMKAAVDRIAAENRGKTVVVVSHGMALKAYLTYADGREWKDYVSQGWADNTAVSIVEYGEDMKPCIKMLNDASHLTDELSTLAFSKWCIVDEEEKSE